MNLICQNSAIQELESLAQSDRHSILIEGPRGCGKTYLAGKYAELLHVENFQLVESTVASVKSAVESVISSNSPIVLCVENLDAGVLAASYAMLKFLEEPTPNAYVVVTCTNLSKVPDTIISRCAVVVTSSPISQDIQSYSEYKNFPRYEELRSNKIWRCVKSLSDCNAVLDMTADHIQYFDELSKFLDFNDTVSNMMWKLGHYSDSTPTPLNIVMNYIITYAPTDFIRTCGIECVKDLNLSRIADHAVLAKFLFLVKYCE